MIARLSTAEVALIVSIASAAVALMTLLWQLVLYRLSGPRPEVRLIPIMLTAIGQVFAGPQPGWGRKLPEEMRKAKSEWWVDLALVQVINVGRTAMSVSEIGLDLGASPWYALWRRHTVAGYPVPILVGAKEVDEVRLEPGQGVSAYLDFWSLIQAARRRHRVHVRGSVRPAGRWRKRSRLRRRWTIHPTQEALWPHDVLTRELRVYQELWRQVVGSGLDKTYEAWLQVAPLLKEGAEHGQFSDALEGIIENPITRVTAAIAIAKAWNAWSSSPDS